MHKRPAHVLGPTLALSLLGGCAFEPYPPLPYPAQPYSRWPQPARTQALWALPGPAPFQPFGESSPGQAEPRERGTGRKLTIRLDSQRFEYTEGGQLVRAGEVSSGSAEHPTPRGAFRVLSKEEDKRSRSYTNFFDQPTPMPYAIQFDGPYFVHEGWLPGHADSHGCVRLHYEDARFIFERIRVGDPVAVVD